MNVNFNPIDMQTWPRRQMFHYFSAMAPTGYSITVEIDVTTFKKSLKEQSIKFFPAYIWLVTKTLNKQIEFKVAVVDDTLGSWETLTPLYPCFHKDDKTMSLMWTEYHEDFNVFYENYLENQKAFGSNHGVLAQPHLLPPANTYTVSCIPWVEFTHFSLHSYSDKPYYFPTVEAGKFVEKNGVITLPLSITVHHATTDGWHISKFIDELQYAMNQWS